MFLYAPIDPSPEEPYRVYRSFRWGTDLELFLLDARSYRSRNDLADTPDAHKTLLGRAQLAWLKRGVAESTATWTGRAGGGVIPVFRRSACVPLC